MPRAFIVMPADPGFEKGSIGARVRATGNPFQLETVARNLDALLEDSARNTDGNMVGVRVRFDLLDSEAVESAFAATTELHREPAKAVWR